MKLTKAQIKMLELIKTAKPALDNNTFADGTKAYWYHFIKLPTGEVRISSQWNGASAYRTVECLAKAGAITITRTDNHFNRARPDYYFVKVNTP